MYRSVDLAFISYENFKVQRDFQREKANLTSDWNTTTLHYIDQVPVSAFRLTRSGLPTSSPRLSRNRTGRRAITKIPVTMLTSPPDQPPSTSPRRFPQDRSGMWRQWSNVSVFCDFSEKEGEQYFAWYVVMLRIRNSSPENLQYS